MYDVVIIGGGIGGYTAAMRAAEQGLHAAVIEKGLLGGTCLNRGCIPAKAYLHIAKTYGRIADSGSCGIRVSGPIIDKKRVAGYLADTVQKLRKGLEYRIKKQGIQIVSGEAGLLDAHTVQVMAPEGRQVLEAGNIILATGSVPQLPKIKGIHSQGMLTTDEIFLPQHIVPDSIVIAGGGITGIEFAFILNRLGSRVTVLEKEDRILGPLGTELSKTVRRFLHGQGVTFYENAELSGIEEADGELVFSVRTPEKQMEIVAEKGLSAAGRKPDTSLTGLKELGIVVTQDGRIVADRNYETSVKGVFAVGDAVNRKQLAYTAAAQGEQVIDYILGNQANECADVPVPVCVYMEPEAAVIGVTEEAADWEGRDIAVGRFRMSENGRAVLEGQDTGYIKVIIDKKEDCLIGAELFCENAADMTGMLATCMAAHMRVQDIRSEILPHPSLIEAVREAVIRAV